MTTTSTSRRALAAVAALTAGLLTATAPTASATGHPLQWAACPDVPEADCATLTVPVDWSDPHGPTVDLAVARRAATDPARRIGVVVVNPGGPGGSGVEFAQDAPSTFSPEVLARFDVVGFDPRGVGASSPILCDLGAVGVAYPDGRPDTPERFDQLAAYNRALAAECRTHTGPVFDRVDAQSAVRDMDALRAALGERKISYFGQSYGTLYGQEYAERYGDRLRAMVVDSVVDAGSGQPGLLVASARAAEDVFATFTRWCDATPSCALHGRDVPALYTDLRGRAGRGELHEPGRPDYPLTAAKLADRTVRAGYGPDWARLADFLVELETQTPETASVESSGPDEPQLSRKPGFAVLCQDFGGHAGSAADVARLDAEVRAAAPTIQAAPIWDLALLSCVGWQGPELNPAAPWTPRRAPEVLMLNSLHDPATGYEGAVEAARQARGKATLVTYEGSGHGVYTRTDCTRATVDAYLLDLTVPAAGTRCPAAG
ncbi:alpha/beta hydrolase [Umezawaea tangerina]|uniref:TAP-like protein n=1 Tax=Umezawaea tangerina TaxID=84725 RepID=A0A2T0T2I5_9PSEU|nr:alpha/beta hydrolase [Umezawaea tangerina]PRY39866.1 TAP-like protein [Umezawaea tangerina]